MAPLFDWDHALDTVNTNDILIRDAIRMVIAHDNRFNTAGKILNEITEKSSEKVYSKRAQFILSSL
jgi:hypothetical protein